MEHNQDYFSVIKGQDKAINYLRNVILHRNVNHAYLFQGPSGTGKMAAALAFAWEIISFTDQDAQIYFKQQIHPDLKIIEIQSNKTKISREQIVKDMEPWLSTRPYRSSSRIVIIRDAHQMTPEAANALLKTLEDPPQDSIIILIADNNDLLETVISRCNAVKFVPLSVYTLVDFLQGKGYEESEAKRIAVIANGSIGNALNFAEEADLKDLWSRSVQVIMDLSRGDAADVIIAAEKMEKKANLMVPLMETVLRDLLTYQETRQEEYLCIPDSKSVLEHLDKIDVGRLQKALMDIGSLKKYYKQNINLLSLNISVCFALRKAFV